MTDHVASTLEDSLLAKVSGSVLIDTTSAIAQWVRLSGEPDERKAFLWIQDKLREYGYRTELSSHPGYISLPGAASLNVAGLGTPIECITHAFAVSTPDHGTSGQLVYSPQGKETPSALRGKIVLTDGMASGVTALHFEKLGAIAQIHILDDHLHETSVSPVWGNPTDETVRALPRLPGISIRRADGERLKAMLEEGEVDVTIHAEVRTGWRTIPMLLADLAGAKGEPFLMLSNHVDSWHYGAMDNGSANATVLEVARLVAEQKQRLRRGLRLAFWSGHSHGRFCGSAYYADVAWSELHEHCIANVFVDSTGGMNAVIVNEPPVMPQTRRLAAAVIEELTGQPFVGKRIGRFADQSFYGVGLNSVFGTLSEQDAATTSGAVAFRTGGKRAGGLGWWWHTPDDTVDKIDESNLVRDTKIYLATVWRLLTEPILPFEYSAAVEELEAAVQELSGRVGGGLDLTALQESLQRLNAEVASLEKATSALDQTDEAALEVANSALVRLSRHLVPVAFHENGRYDHDRMEPLRPLPSLQPASRLAELDPSSDESLFLQTRCRRAVNWVHDEIHQACEVAAQAVAALRAS